MKVLLVSNTYVESILLCALDKLLSNAVTRIILLEENHNKNENINCIHEIMFCPNLDEGIKQCEMVLLARYPEMNLLLEDKIKNCCNNYKRKFMVIENLCNNQIQQTDNIGIDTIKNKNAPVICLLSIGAFNQHVCIEIILNKIFKEIGVNVQQHYSIEMKNLLRQLTSEIERADKNNKHYEVIIQSIIHDDVNDVLRNEELLKIMEAAKPDCTIINIEPSLVEMCDIDALIKNIEIRYNIKIDMIISSSFCNIKDNKNSSMPIYYNKEQSDTIYSIGDINLENIIKQKILTKITFPSDVKLL